MTDTPTTAELPTELDAALTRLEQAVAARQAVRPSADSTEERIAEQPGEAENLRRKLDESEAEVQRLTRALAVAEKRRMEALAKVDAAVGQVDMFLAQPEVR